jgi:hypothetical protein
MKQKKFISVIGAAALLLGLGMNLQYALEDYGFTKNPLSGFMLVQAATTGDMKKEKGRKQEDTTGECTIKSTGSVSSATTSTSSKTNAGGGEIEGGVPVVKGKVSASTTKSSGGTDVSGTSDATELTTTCKVKIIIAVSLKAARSVIFITLVIN